MILSTKMGNKKTTRSIQQFNKLNRQLNKAQIKLKPTPKTTTQYLNQFIKQHKPYDQYFHHQQQYKPHQTKYNNFPTSNPTPTMQQEPAVNSCQGCMNKRISHKVKNLYNTLTSIYSNEQIVRNCMNEHDDVDMEKYERCVDRYRARKITFGLQESG